MLNPDGVANGYTRLDTNGLNLNAYYKHANKKTPTIYALKRFIKFLSDRKVLHSYIDLHAHTTKRGIFFFANPLNEDNYKETLEIPYLFYDYQKEFTFTRSSMPSFTKDLAWRRENRQVEKNFSNSQSVIDCMSSRQTIGGKLSH